MSGMLLSTIALFAPERGLLNFKISQRWLYAVQSEGRLNKNSTSILVQSVFYQFDFMPKMVKALSSHSFENSNNKQRRGKEMGQEQNIRKQSPKAIFFEFL